MVLFSENFNPVDTDEALASLQQQFPQYDPAYVCQAAGAPRHKVKEWMEELWKQYEPFSDSHFLDDFKRQFSQRSWELYLGVTLLNRSFKLGKHSNSGPDFDVQDVAGKRLTWIEAIAVDKGDGIDKVPEMEHGFAADVPEEKMLLRITNALDKKLKQFQDHLTKGIINENEPYVIALNRSGLNHVDPGLPLILKALFGIGYQSLRIMVGGVRQENPQSSWTGRPNIPKQNGKDISMLFFENPKNNGVSAVIYSIDSIINSPHLPDQMGENFTVIHNPLAKNPLPDGFFPFGDEHKAEEGYINRIRKAKNWEKLNLF